MTSRLARISLGKRKRTANGGGVEGLIRERARRVIGRWREVDAPALEWLGTPRRFWHRGGGYDRNVVGEFLEKALYIHENPVRRGLVERAGDWVWSSARWYERGEGLEMDEVRRPG